MECLNTDHTDIIKDKLLSIVDLKLINFFKSMMRIPVEQREISLFPFILEILPVEVSTADNLVCSSEAKHCHLMSAQTDWNLWKYVSDSA